MSTHGTTALAVATSDLDTCATLTNTHISDTQHAHHTAHTLHTPHTHTKGTTQGWAADPEDDSERTRRAPWWLNSDGEHAHTACPLRPFAHMVVALPDGEQASSTEAGGTCAWAGEGCTIDPPISAERLTAAAVVHMSDTLRRKLHGAAAGATVGDILVLAAQDSVGDGERAAPAARVRAMSTGLWHMLEWLVGSHEGGTRRKATSRLDNLEDGHVTHTPLQRRRHAVVRDDDPQLVGNEGLGTVELASARAARHGGVFAVCAHALSAEGQCEWQAWQARRGTVGTAAGVRLAVVHVAEVSTLHRVACGGLDALVPPELALEQHFARMLDGTRTLGPPPQLPALRVDGRTTTTNAAIRWMSLLVSRHGLVEMAFPLTRTVIAPADGFDAGLQTGPAVALASSLGESLFARVHPEDVARVVKALRLAWDARPDVYHFARLRREWQRRRLGADGGRAVASAPSTPPLRPARAATLDAARFETGRLDTGRRVLHRDGIEVANGIVELTMQLQVAGAATDVDWTDADSMAAHTRFARMRLTRWPLIAKPSRHTPEEPPDGFVLVAVRPLPEPARMREPLNVDRKQRSISSVASTSTLVGVARTRSGSSGASGLDAAELARLCRCASSLSCHETIARPSIEFSDVPRATQPSAGVPIPASRPVVALVAHAVNTATAMSPHLSMRRRSNIPVGSHPGPTEDGLAAQAVCLAGGLAY
ncbi:hypothetical protein COEREDRAFT_87624 [Coemansia reversa NRRL 1564]|uniref:Uncharacterized protein n=1 Tax=Coemansia reversa (strain ATCC 12441 / NRRL 1564) TaxID=763665 RepID=A0A2G5B9H5_COERN|nr:hypothetical protein COEREDRAFT_87624 [Coemansia reversa NRRL 1564]|eukprot:PIA15661.1 hypothetical protein COEREDRAFT_87624 [Coemansia reversa NRRL 1564]